MRQEKELNKSEERNLNKVHRRVDRHQNKKSTDQPEQVVLSDAANVIEKAENIENIVKKEDKELKEAKIEKENSDHKEHKEHKENKEHKEKTKTEKEAEKAEEKPVPEQDKKEEKKESEKVAPQISEKSIAGVSNEKEMTPNRKEKKEKKQFVLPKLFSKKEKTEGADSSNSDNDGKKLKQKKEAKEKTPRPKGKLITLLAAIFFCIVLFTGIVGAIGAFIFARKLCEDKPTLNVSDLVSPDSTTVYDSDGVKIMELGMYLRENITYNEMPNNLIDAFLAIEDSRFFEHRGFDIPRFTKAALANFRTRDFSQGGSTITMQLIKNSYFSIDDDENSTIAARSGMSGIKRKMQEIVLSLELENFTDVTKQEIIAMYINKVNYGNNIRGVEKAAEYYFGKEAKNLNLSESAFLAGLINSPNTYNPYNDLYKENNYYLDPDTEYLQNATKRRNEVLDLMVMHGYISEKEADLAKSVRMEDLLAGVDISFSETNEKYQSYIDAVIDEVIDVTGESPYEVGMEIYTNMNAYMQEYVYDMQNGAEYIGLKFPNDLCQSAIVVMDNQNGAIEALGAGRGEIDSARQFNRATSAYLNPGSSIKPVIDYALCIEYLGYSTSHTFTDMPYYLYDGNVLISNYDHVYYGDMLMTEALGRSQNTPAVQALAAVVAEKGEEFVVDYMNSIGFNFEYADFDLQFAIGGNRCLVTPLQMAGAHAMFINGGRYIRPHTVNHIVYNDNRDNFVADTQGTQTLSKETAWMVAYLEDYNMTGSYSSLMWYCKKGRDYPLYGKTGTTDWADSGTDYGIPVGATKDSWLVMQTNKYTISCWTGYDKLEKGAYFTSAEYQENTKSKIVSKILDELETHHLGEYDPYKPLVKPDTVEEVDIVKGAYPYAYPSGGYPTVKAYFPAKTLQEHPLVSADEALQVAKQNKKHIDGGIANLNASYDGETVFVTFGTGGGENGVCVGESCDLSSSNVYGETTYAAGRIWFPHWSAVYSGGANPPYFYTITSDTGEVISGATEDTAISEGIGGGRVQVCVTTSGAGSQACVAVSAG